MTEAFKKFVNVPAREDGIVPLPSMSLGGICPLYLELPQPNRCTKLFFPHILRSCHQQSLHLFLPFTLPSSWWVKKPTPKRQPPPYLCLYVVRCYWERDFVSETRIILAKVWPNVCLFERQNQQDRRVCQRVCVCTRARACMCMCLCVYVHVCACVYACVCDLYLILFLRNKLNGASSDQGACDTFQADKSFLGPGMIKVTMRWSV